MQLWLDRVGRLGQVDELTGTDAHTAWSEAEVAAAELDGLARDIGVGDGEVAVGAEVVGRSDISGLSSGGSLAIL